MNLITRNDVNLLIEDLEDFLTKGVKSSLCENAIKNFREKQPTQGVSLNDTNIASQLIDQLNALPELVIQTGVPIGYKLLSSFHEKAVPVIGDHVILEKYNSEILYGSRFQWRGREYDFSIKPEIDDRSN